MKYLNGQWWYHHNAGEAALIGAVELIADLRKRIDAESRPLGTLGRLAALEDLLDTEGAYSAGAEYGLAQVISPADGNEATKPVGSPRRGSAHWWITDRTLPAGS